MPSAARHRDPVGSVASTTHRLGIFGQLLAVAALTWLGRTDLAACDCETPGSSVAAAAIARAGAWNHHHHEPGSLHCYATGASTLRTEALRAGTLTYQQVIDAAYGTGVVDQELLSRKAQWRATVGRGFVFLADYSQLRASATVRPLVALADPTLQSTLVAQYESVLHVIGISNAASDYAIFHEAGHALQRASLRSRGGASGRRSEGSEFILDEQLRTDAADETSIHRLLYLSSQDEFEVRLQDLNRFYARLVGSGPIFAPEETVRALTALGIPLEYEETRDAFALGGIAFSREDFAAVVETDRWTGGAMAVAFEDARELKLLRRLAQRVAPAHWPRLLAKIIFEAPGHL